MGPTVKRLATSVMLVARANGLPTVAGTSAVVAMTRSYRLAVRGYATAGYLATFYAKLDAWTLRSPAYWLTRSPWRIVRRARPPLSASAGARF